MKKIIATLLIAALALSFAACGAKDTEPATNNDTPAVEDTAPAADPNETPVEDDMPAADPNETPVGDDMPAVDGGETAETPETPALDGTVGSVLAADFKAAAEADSEATAETLVNNLVGSAAVAPIAPIPMPVEEGLLTGFDNFEVKGFSDALMLAPMIGTIPFVAYVFTVADGVDAAAFAEELKTNANPRWNICTEAEETVTEVVGNKVFFAMCPMSFEA